MEPDEGESVKIVKNPMNQERCLMALSRHQISTSQALNLDEKTLAEDRVDQLTPIQTNSLRHTQDMKKLNIIDKEEKDHCLMKASDMDRRIAGEEGVDDQRGPNQEMGMQVNIVGEAGEDHQLTPIQAAELFAEKYLPDLSKKSVSLPRERVDYGCSTQVFLSDKQRGKAEFANEKEESDFHKYKNFTTGAEAEINVLKYIEKSIDGPFAMFWSYTQLKTYRFLGIKEENKITDKPGDWNTEQEFDLLILLPRQKLFVIFEVKSFVGKLQKKTLDPLI